MDYNWLVTHDPITIDANLAEIDFDDFKNEDIQNAYAFSLQSYVSNKICFLGNFHFMFWTKHNQLWTIPAKWIQIEAIVYLNQSKDSINCIDNTIKKLYFCHSTVEGICSGLWSCKKTQIAQVSGYLYNLMLPLVFFHKATAVEQTLKNLNFPETNIVKIYQKRMMAGIVQTPTYWRWDCGNIKK